MNLEEYAIEDVFNVSKSDLLRVMRYELERCYNDLVKMFNYVSTKLIDKGYVVDITDRVSLDIKTDINQYKGKRLNWFVIQYKNVTMVVRAYNSHFAVMCKYTNEVVTEAFPEITPPGDKDKDFIHRVDMCSKHYSFVIHTDSSAYEDDVLYDNPAMVFEVIIKDVINCILKNGVLGDVLALKCPKGTAIIPVHEDAQVFSIDKMIFLCEEFSAIHMSLYSEVDILEILKSIQCVCKGKLFGSDIVSRIRINESNFHSCGVILIKKGSKETKLQDVYSIARQHLPELRKLVEDCHKIAKHTLSRSMMSTI